MEATSVLTTAAPVHDEPWGITVEGTTMPVEAISWMDGDTPCLRLFVQSSPVTGHLAVVTYEGQAIASTEMTVTINRPFAITMRYPAPR
jgi:hypothetical protein